jgi:CRISPR-associated protein Cas1
METGASDRREVSTMANLYLTEQGAVLRKTGERLLVEKDDKELLEIECFNRH